MDTFAKDHLPSKELWPAITANGIENLNYPQYLNAAVELLDRHIESGLGSEPCLRIDNTIWSYQDLQENANRLANLLVSYGLQPGERVLLRDANTPMLPVLLLC